MKGFGTVVTGTLMSGTIRREEEFEIFPAGQHVRVRGVQVHGRATDQATAGQRTALNLAGAATEDLSRGMTLAPAATFQSTRLLDVRLSMLASAPRALKSRSRVHFHANTMETVAEITLPGIKQLSPGAEAFARMKLPLSALLLPGDRFIIRQFSPVVTIGGGTVLDSLAAPRAKQLEPFLQALNGGSVETILQSRVVRHGQAGVALARLIAETGLTQAAIENGLASAMRDHRISNIADIFVNAADLAALREAIVESVGSFHQKNPLMSGVAKEALRELVRASAEIFASSLNLLASDRKIELDGDLVRLPGRGVVLKDEEAESKKQIEEAFASTGLKVPALSEVLAGLKIDKVRAQKIVTLLLREKALIKISEQLVFHRTALETLRRTVTSQKAKTPKIDVSTFKELAGVSRKYAIPLLEYLDREHVTRRVGDAREIL
jgi:selenocysteine-specific elongation factor